MAHPYRDAEDDLGPCEQADRLKTRLHNQSGKIYMSAGVENWRGYYWHTPIWMEYLSMG